MLTATIAAAMLLTQSAQQFDLICTGTMESGSNLTPTTTKPITERYRFDLDRMVWCSGECLQATNVHTANQAEIVLQDAERGREMRAVARVNRTNGRLINNFETAVGRDRIFVRTTSQCTRADYTPIPVAQF